MCNPFRTANTFLATNYLESLRFLCCSGKRVKGSVKANQNCGETEGIKTILKGAVTAKPNCGGTDEYGVKSYLMNSSAKHCPPYE